MDEKIEFCLIHVESNNTISRFSFYQYLSSEETCPMCGEKVLTENVTKITNLEEYLNPKEEE